MPLDRITITGADDDTSIAEMLRLSEEFPFLEWGILASQSRLGTPRYPGMDWCYRLASARPPRPLSLHVCGAWGRGLFAGTCDVTELPFVFWVAGRIQVNGTPVEDAPLFVQGDNWPQLIFQYPRAAGYLALCRDALLYAVPLWDESGGEGIRRDSWPAALPGMYNGYAGGIGPDNVVDVVGKIQEVCEGPFWIDMEGHMRDDDNRLDLTKVRRVLELCAPLIAEAGNHPRGVL